LFQTEAVEGEHFVDIWNHKEIIPKEGDWGVYIPVTLDPFKKEFLGTNNEGAVGCIAKFPAYLEVYFQAGKVSIKSRKKGIIRIWQSAPDYSKTPIEFLSTEVVYDPGKYEGDLVIQLFDQNELLDERVIFISPGHPKLISQVKNTKPNAKTPGGMVLIPSGKFKPRFEDGDTFIYYPRYEGPETVELKAFFMDVHPVTNGEFYSKIRVLASGHYKFPQTLGFKKNASQSEGLSSGIHFQERCHCLFRMGREKTTYRARVAVCGPNRC
jgi:hypothetical protein